MFIFKVFIELSKFTGVNVSSITQAYKRLDKILKDTISFSENSSTLSKRNDDDIISQFIPRMIANLELPNSLIYKIKKIVTKSSPFLAGKKPITIAAASLLLYLRNSNVEPANTITDKDVANVANCHIITLKNAYSILNTNKHSIFEN